MRYGRRAPKGFLPVFSVGSEKEAEYLLTMACQRNLRHEFVARELAAVQNIDTLVRFSNRLEELHDRYIVPNGRCDCKKALDKKSKPVVEFNRTPL